MITSLHAPSAVLGRWTGGHVQDRLGREEAEDGPSVGRGDAAYVRMWGRKGNEGEDERDFQNDEPQRLEDDDKV